MKNIEKKWTLFLVATFFTFFGIVNVFVKGTKASDVIGHSAFDDMNFYKCVVDNYNAISENDVLYTDAMSDEQFASLTALDCLGGVIPEEEKIVSVKGIEKLVNLVTLKLNNQKIESIDLSQNLKLTSLWINGNELTELDLTKNTNLKVVHEVTGDFDFKFDKGEFDYKDVVYVHENLTFYESIKLPNDYDINFEIDNDEETSLENGVFSSEIPGKFVVNASINVNNENYSLYKGEFYVINLISSKYEINNIFESIYVGVIDDEIKSNLGNLLKQNITVSSTGIEEIDNKIELVYDEKNYTLFVIYEGRELKQFNVYGIEFDDLEESFKVEGDAINFSKSVLYSDFHDVIKTNRNDMEVKIYYDDDNVENSGKPYLETGMSLNVYQIVMVGEEDELYFLYSYDIFVNEYSFSDRVDKITEIGNDCIFSDGSETNCIMTYVPLGMKLEDVLTLSESVNVIILNKDGEKYSSNDISLKNGDKIELTLSNGDEKRLYHIVTIGDINSSGQITIDDIKILAEYMVTLDSSLLYGTQNYIASYLAADMNGDSKISISDLVSLYNYWKDIQS